jgi:LmbE family N-acetylglucosaminyl deacetylase
MADSKLRVLVFGAHPDDPDSKSGGTAALYTKAGHVVKMVSLTNGDAGHMWEGGAPLAWRRRIEAANSGKALGCEYITLDSHDGMLLPTLEVRNEVIAIVRDFKPDLVLCPRMWDYHPDHRACGVVVVDAMYMATVPNVVSGAEHLRKMPVIAYGYDHFQKPYPIQPDVVVDISSVLEQKIDALGCHTSQMYEWLPYNRRELDQVPEGEAERRAWLGEMYHSRSARQADFYRAELIARYGEAKGRACVAVEVYEGSEYGSPLTAENKDILFPF